MRRDCWLAACRATHIDGASIIAGGSVDIQAADTLENARVSGGGIAAVEAGGKADVTITGGDLIVSSREKALNWAEPTRQCLVRTIL